MVPLILGQDDITDEPLGMIHLNVVSIIDTMQFHGDKHKRARKQRCQRQCCADAKMQPVHDVPPNDLHTVGARRSRQQRAHRRSHLPIAVIPSVVIVPDVAALVTSRTPGVAQQSAPECDFLCCVMRVSNPPPAVHRADRPCRSRYSGRFTVSRCLDKLVRHPTVFV